MPMPHQPLRKTWPVWCLPLRRVLPVQTKPTSTMVRTAPVTTAPRQVEVPAS